MENDLMMQAEYGGAGRLRNGWAGVPDYNRCPVSLAGRVLAFLGGFVAGAAVLFVFYRLLPLALGGGLLAGAVYIFIAGQNAVSKRRLKLRRQFFDLLEALSVSLRAGNPAPKALQSARDDLLLIYPPHSDIIVELDIIAGKFHNSIPLSAAFSDLAARSGLEDIASFATIYAAIEGKSGRTGEIVRETQQIIADKMAIEMEIETMMAAAKNEVNIMLILPLLILGIIGYLGAGFMDAIYTTAMGRVVATVGLGMFVISYVLARRISRIRI